MKRLDYLKYAIANNCFYKKSWIISAFGIIKEDPNAYNKDPYIGKIVKQTWGFSFVTAEGKLEPIDDTKGLETLFTWKEAITIDNSWIANANGPIDTYIGNLIFNAVSIVPSFGSKIDFVTGRVSISKLEAYIAERLKDTPAPGEETSSEYIYVNEYVKFVDSLSYIGTFTQLSTWAATPKNMVAPPGIKEFKQKLVEKYGDKLSDPVVLAQFEQELKDFDEKHLAGDPSNGTFIAGKIKNIARKKMFLTMGAEQLTFSDTQKPVAIINSLEEGLPTDPVQFTAMMNGLRIGSFARGAETVKGGVSAKYLLRAANNFRVIDTDCGTKLGIRRHFDETTIDKLVNRYVIEGNKLIFVENKTIASNYLNRDTVIVRSPMYCTLEGDSICKICAGARLAQYPDGLSIPLTEESAIILASFMALMHGKVLATAKMRLDRTFS